MAHYFFFSRKKQSTIKRKKRSHKGSRLARCRRRKEICQILRTALLIDVQCNEWSAASENKTDSFGSSFEVTHFMYAFQELCCHSGACEIMENVILVGRYCKPKMEKNKSLVKE